MANFCPTTENICISRGDSPIIFMTISDADNQVQDITGFTFLLTVNTSPVPSSTAGQVFQVTGVIVDNANGQVSFQPSTSNTDQEPNIYFYDVQMTTTTPSVRTVLAGQFEIQQDITKV